MVCFFIFPTRYGLIHPRIDLGLPWLILSDSDNSKGYHPRAWLSQKIWNRNPSTFRHVTVNNFINPLIAPA